MDPFALSFLLLCSLFSTINYGYCNHPPFEYWHTLSDFSQGKTHHCANQSAAAPDRLLCELEGAIDAQAQPTSNRKNVNPSQTSPTASKRSCKFREEDIYSSYPYSMLPSSTLNRVLDKYVAMHSRCLDMESADLDEIYGSSKKPICQYLIFAPSGAGLGNRIMALISSFLYAIMSARVLILDYPDWGELFCEPFSSSTIQLPATTKLRKRLGPSYVEFRDSRCGGPSPPASNKICKTTLVNMLLDHTTMVHEFESITCPMGYARLRNIPFVTVRDSNQYFAPGYYLNPAVSPLLDLLFPQRNPFHLLSRVLLTPSDGMWDSIKSNLDVQANRRIGVQVREPYEAYKPEYDDSILKCIKRYTGLTPRWFRRRVRAGEHFRVYMATLEKRHLKMAEATIRRLTNESGVEFELSFQRLDGREVHDTKHQEEALTDMWVLSLSHTLITTQESTFGYVATGLGGLKANFLEKDAGKRPGCFVGLGFEPCFHAAPKSLSCTLEESEGFSLHDSVQRGSKVKVCNDRESGWTVMPSGESTVTDL